MRMHFVTLALVAASLAWAAAPAPFAAFRGNGSGAFPTDCTHVSTWSEAGWEWRKQEIVSAPTWSNPAGGGQVSLGWVPRLTDKAAHNVVWRTRLPWWGNGGVVVAKGRLYLMREMDPGVADDARGVLACRDTLHALPDIAIDAPIPDGWQPGPSLVCLDPVDGKVLWSRGVHGMDLLPEAERTKFRAEAWWYTRFNWRRWQLVYRLEALDRANGGGPTSKTPGAGLLKRPDETRALLKALRDIGCRSLADADIDAVLAGRSELPVRKGSYSPLGVPAPSTAVRIKALRAKGFWFTGYGPHGNDGPGGYDQAGQQYAGEACQTPAWDGTRIYVTTTNRVVAAYTPDGTPVWQVRLTGTDNTSRAFDQLSSPIAVDGKLIIYTAGKTATRALDSATGKVLWEVPRAEAVNPFGAGGKERQPVLLTVAGMQVLYQCDGLIVRVADGKVLATKIGASSGHSCPVAVDDTLYIFCSGNPAYQFAEAAKDTLQAIRFTMDGPDAAKGTRLWQTGADVKAGSGSSGPVVANGLVFCAMEGSVSNGTSGAGIYVYEAATGALVKRLLPRVRSPGGRMSGDVWTGLWCPATAGGKVFYASPKDGMFTVIEATREAKIVGQDNFLLGRIPDGHPSPVDEWMRFPTMLPINFSGNRTFIRAHEYVYGIGDPKAPLQLSEEHR